MMLRMDAEARRAVAVARHGPEARATARCLWEDALYDVAALLFIMSDPGQAPSLMGWTGGPRSSLPPEVRREVGGAVRMPATVAATLAEHRHCQERAEVRAAFNPDAEPPLWIRARVLLLKERLDTLPARERDDVLARLDWMAAVLDFEFSRPIEEDEACLATMRQDIENGAVPCASARPICPIWTRRTLPTCRVERRRRYALARTRAARTYDSQRYRPRRRSRPCPIWTAAPHPRGIPRGGARDPRRGPA